LKDLAGKSTSVLEDQTGATVLQILEKEHPEDNFTVYAEFQLKTEIVQGESRRNLSEVRRLQQSIISGLEVALTLYVETRSPMTYNKEKLQASIEKAFDTNEELTGFIEALQKSDSAFSPINDMAVSIDNTPVVLQTGGGFAWLYIGIGTGVSAIAISAFLFIGYRRRNRNQSPYENQGSSGGSDSGDLGTGQIIATQGMELSDISTLGDPFSGGPTGMFGANFVQADDQQNESTLSAGYDYKLAYLGAGDLPSVSSAGGTRSAEGNRALADDLTQDGDEPRHRIDSVDSSRVSGAQEDLSLFEEDNSFDQMYGEDERIEIIAPPGKLGVVIDTPMNGFPMVHAIKETSVLSGRVRIGDKLVSVDGEDTTEMSAIKVSKLISSKAMNPQRRMLFLRSPG